MNIGIECRIVAGPLAGLEGIVQEVNDGVVTLAYFDAKGRLRTVFIVERLLSKEVPA